MSQPTVNSDEGAFIRAFREEMDAAAAQQLRETYIWANSALFAMPDPELVRRADEWASRIEAEGKTWAVLMALASRDE